MAKLRVGWIVAGWAFGVRTITRRVLFHCTTGLTGRAAESSASWRTLSAGAPKDPLDIIERPRQRVANAIKIFDMRGFLFLCIRAGDAHRETNALQTCETQFPFVIGVPSCAPDERRHQNRDVAIAVTRVPADLFLF